ncbi:hypothetical protein FISHEDRAFT_38795 [Fistulina hepatica ATCC 64428]|uniref:Uncharacterized protein n=1 Tax=Fistulina hepatica ATCC 64428 TaxID=1128425 RepID=A0A0D7AJJ3_9AGAR|nr:hypothetical protein FISHEDRAFT_38795 [Fistulina hepatica ATCC 64428]
MTPPTVSAILSKLERTLPTTDVLRGSYRTLLHRFEAIDSRKHRSWSAGEKKRDFWSDIASLPDQQKAYAKGYEDGFMAAKTFATYNLSRLGFTQQYIADTVAPLVPTVVSEHGKTYYVNGFMSGLGDGESTVDGALQASK